MIFVNLIQRFDFYLLIYINYTFNNTKIKKIVNQSLDSFIKKSINF